MNNLSFLSKEVIRSQRKLSRLQRQKIEDDTLVKQYISKMVIKSQKLIYVGSMCFR